MATVIPTYILDLLIEEDQGDTTISELRTAQLAALEFDCPNCAATSGLINLVRSDGVTVQISDPLCNGMGKVSVDYDLVTDESHWTPAPTPPPDIPPVEEP
jgi:hypothetical protein